MNKFLLLTAGLACFSGLLLAENHPVKVIEATSPLRSAAGKIHPNKFRLTEIDTSPYTLPPYLAPLLIPHGDSQSYLGFTDKNQDAHIWSLNAADRPDGKKIKMPGRQLLNFCTHKDGLTVLNCKYSGPDQCHEAYLTKFSHDGRKIFDQYVVGGPTTPAVGKNIYDNWSTPRLVCAPDRYAAYFSVQKNFGPVRDVHQGDMLAYFDRKGNRLQGGWDFGISHSLEQAVGYNGHNWVSAAKGDSNPRGIAFICLGCEIKRTNLFPMDGKGGDNYVHVGLGQMITGGGRTLLTFATKQGRRSYDPGLMSIDRQGRGKRIWLARTPRFHEYSVYMAPYGSNFLLGYARVPTGVKKPKVTFMGAIMNADGRLLGKPVELPYPFAVKGVLKESAWYGGDIQFMHTSGFVPYPNGDVAWLNANAWRKNKLIQLVRYKSR